jgi:hypothetical protein
MAFYEKKDYFARMEQMARELDEMLETTSGFEKLISEENIDKLEAGLRLRQKNLNNIAAIQGELDKMEPQPERAFKEEEAYGLLLSRVQKARDEIIRLDEQGRKLGGVKLDEFRSGMRTNEENKKGITAYMNTGAQSNIFDEKS